MAQMLLQLMYKPTHYVDQLINVRICQKFLLFYLKLITDQSITIALLDSPITRLQVYSSDKIQPAEKFDVSLLPNKDSILSSNVFHLGHDNNVLIIRPYLHNKLSDSDTRYSLLVTMNGTKIFPTHSQQLRTTPKDGLSSLFELHLPRGMTSKIECTCDSGTTLANGQQDINRATFLLFTYVAPKDI